MYYYLYEIKNNVNGKFYGKKHSIESLAKMAASAAGKQTAEKNSQFGSMWITNGYQNKKINKDSALPDGWRRGRKIIPQNPRMDLTVNQ